MYVCDLHLAVMTINKRILFYFNRFEHFYMWISPFISLLSNSMFPDRAVRLMSDFSSPECSADVVMLYLTLCLEELERLANERVIKET